VDEAYRPLVEGLRASAVAACFQGPDQLVVSRQDGAVRPSDGNSFWVSHREGIWYLCTWAPTCYRVPREADLVSLCAEFAERAGSAQSRVPPSLVQRYRLVQLSSEDAGSLLGW
jgi:hypothetical protein